MTIGYMPAAGAQDAGRWCGKRPFGKDKPGGIPYTKDLVEKALRGFFHRQTESRCFQFACIFNDLTPLKVQARSRAGCSLAQEQRFRQAARHSAGGSKKVTVMTTARCTSALILALALGACASDPNKPPSGNFAKATARSEAYRCPVGQVLTCEAKKTGRIRFGRMGGENLESCSCEVETGMPVNSPLPGIY